MKPRFALLGLLALAACSRSAAPDRSTEHIANSKAATSTPAAVSAEKPAPPREPLGPSIYDLPVTLATASGERVGLDTARGKPVLVSMFYASCAVACPLILSEVAQVLAELPPDVRAETRVLLVSFDPERDTPAKLRELAVERKLGAQWTVAVANDADTRALAAVLGVKYRKLASGEFAHGSTILALDREGRPIARTDSLGQREGLLAALVATR